MTKKAIFFDAYIKFPFIDKYCLDRSITGKLKPIDFLLHFVLNGATDPALALYFKHIHASRQLDKVIDLHAIASLASAPEIRCGRHDIFSNEPDHWSYIGDVVENEILELKTHHRLPA